LIFDWFWVVTMFTQFSPDISCDSQQTHLWTRPAIWSPLQTCQLSCLYPQWLQWYPY